MALCLEQGKRYRPHPSWWGVIITDGMQQNQAPCRFTNFTRRMWETWPAQKNSFFCCLTPCSECPYRYLLWILGIQSSQRKLRGGNLPLGDVPPFPKQVSGKPIWVYCGTFISLGDVPSDPNMAPIGLLSARPCQRAVNDHMGRCYGYAMPG